VPGGKEEEVKSLFPHHTSSEKPSKNGKYISITINMMMPSSEAVIEVYRVASTIEGIIAL
jgi:putative lipoic acid-binding regulatory protein